MVTTKYLVKGMTCGHCVNSVSTEVSAIPGVNEVTVDLASGEVTVSSSRTPRRAGGPRGRRRGRLRTRHPQDTPTTPEDEVPVMNTTTKLGAFALGLAAVFGAAYGAGQVAGPVTPAADPSHHASTDAPSGHTATGDGHTEPGDTSKDETTGGMPGGLLVSDRGYTLTPVPAAAGEFAFRVTGPDGAAVTAYDVEHDKRMHLIVARRDLSGFRHVHPEMDADGTWRVTSPLGEPGSWRAFADFKPTGGGPADPRHRRTGPRRLHAPTAARPGDQHDRRRLHRHPRRHPGTRTDQQADPDREPRRHPGHRPAALPRRVRPPRRAARRRPGLPARPPRRRPRRRQDADRARRSPSTPRSPRPAPTGCSWTSNTPARSARPSSP